MCTTFHRLFGLAVVAGALAAAGASRAESLLDAPVAYSATRTTTVDGRTYVGTVHHVAGKERQEENLFGAADLFIVDGTDNKGWLVVPALRSFVAFPFPPIMTVLTSPTLKKTRVGDEIVDGIETAKYAIHTRASDGTVADGFAWFSRRGVLMKLQGSVTARQGHRTAVAMVLHGVKETPQDAALFVPPPGYTQLPPEALQPLLGTQAQ
ncbi:MAG TPA: hypothetical protein VJS41_12365 [Stellaceae bacterium]|nr:hypothetical protein [Stellaceae bacterium]